MQRIVLAGVCLLAVAQPLLKASPFESANEDTDNNQQASPSDKWLDWSDWKLPFDELVKVESPAEVPTKSEDMAGEATTFEWPDLSEWKKVFDENIFEHPEAPTANHIGDDDEADEFAPFDSVFDHPGYSPADTPQKLSHLGIDSSRLDLSIVEDSQILVPELITKYGYGVETHHIYTTDGYILEMHRITSSPRANNSGADSATKPPVLLVHGLLDSSSTWVLMGPYHGLGYLLADRGYDVWMGNVRGNRYSRRHRHLNPDGRRSDRRRFWEFSWHEIGTIDVPHMVDLVLAETGFTQLHYIGHSQGTTSFFVMCAERPEYNAKILAMQALAPVAFMSNLQSPVIRAAALFLNSLDTATSLLGLHEFLPNNAMLGQGANIVCQDGSFVQALCSNVLFLIAGSNPDQLNTTMIPVIAGHTPAGASTQSLVHYGQLMRSGRFRRFDHGVRNMARYGSLRPPAYDLRRVVAPVALHYSSNDWLAAVRDVEELHQALPNVVGKFLVPDRRFNHLDFVWAMDVERLLYSRVFRLMRLAEESV